MASEQLPALVARFRDLQQEIVTGLEALDGSGIFTSELWTRPEGGGGDTRILEEGSLIVKGGVLFSHVYGPLPELVAVRLKHAPGEIFHATGVSIVLHPWNPYVPIIHMNVRYFEVGDHTWWFGGGIDVTPAYVRIEQARWFHEGMKAVCDRHDPEYYTKFKAWCDKYFYLPHRQETRGIGGIFFDHLNGPLSEDRARIAEFVFGVGKYFLPAYTQQAQINRNIPFGERELDWQAYRRGRYVEFNLAYDAGTRFGLETNGRTESILMSMPPMARWKYNFRPEPGTSEAFTQAALKPWDWLTATEAEIIGSIA